MGLLQSIVKFYLVVLIFRTVMTRQELYFNPLGKLVGKMTDPVLEKVLKLTKKNADNILPVFIIIAVLLNGLIIFMLTGLTLPIAMIAGFADLVTFLMLFYIISVLMGSMAGNSNMSHYAMFFKRIGSFWVKLTRTFIPIKTNMVIIPSVVVIFIFFTLVNTGASLGLQMMSSSFDLVSALRTAFKTDFLALIGLLDIFVWLIIIRALMSWVSPDPRNPIVQLIAALTDPVLIPFKRVIPPLGAIDISPMILIFVVYFIKTIMVRLVGIMF
ncbi:MAG: YggT family protein [Denitrovibrio sp.]|nr:MAG: YggT family protein [Denitrovibrio sp.]